MLALFSTLAFLSALHAPAVNASSVGTVTFTFDDGRDGQRTLAADILRNNRIAATAFDFVGSLTMGRGFMNESRLFELQDSYGWEVGSHSYTHPRLNGLTAAQLHREIASSKSELVSRGFQITTFAYPYGQGAGNTTVRQLVEKNYAAARSSTTTSRAILHDQSSDIYNIIANDVSNTTRPVTVEGWVDQAITSRKWLVLLFHQIVTTKPGFETYYLSSDLDAIASYVKAKVDQGLLTTATFARGVQRITQTDSQSQLQALLFVAVVPSALAAVIVAGVVLVMRHRQAVHKNCKAETDELASHRTNASFSLWALQPARDA